MIQRVLLPLFVIVHIINAQFPDLQVSQTIDSLEFSWTGTQDHGLTTDFIVAVDGTEDGGPYDPLTLENTGSILISSLSSGVEYIITFRNYTNANEVFKTETARTLPRAPTLASAAGVPASPGDIRVEWIPAVNSNEDNYMITYDPTDGESVSGTDNGETSPKTLTGLTPGDQYTITVRAVSGSGAPGATESAESSPLMRSTYPNAVTDLSVSRNVDDPTGSVDLSWTPLAGLGAKFIVEYTPSGGPLSTHPVNDITATGTTLDSLLAGTSYTVVVATESSYDGYTTRTTPAQEIITQPNTPGVTVTAADASSLTLSIDGGPGRRDRYSVMYEDLTNSTGQQAEDATGTDQTITHDINGLTAGHDYRIVVTAFSGVDASSASEPVEDNTAPSAAIDVTVGVVSATTVSVTWTDPSFAGSFEVTYYATDNNGAAKETTTCTVSGCIIDVQEAGHPGTGVTVFVTAIKGARKSVEASGSGNTMPLAPEDLRIQGTVGSTTATLKADKPADTVVDVLTVLVTPPKQPTVTAQNDVYTIELDGLTPGVTYQVVVYFVVGTAVVESDRRNIAFHTLPPTPGVISEVSDSSTTGSITVTWPNIESSQGTFTVYRASLMITGQPSQQQDVNRAADMRRATFTQLTAGTSYMVQLITVVVSGNTERESDSSTGDFTTNPNPVTNVRINDVNADVTTNSLRIIWSAPSQGGYDEFLVKRGSDEVTTSDTFTVVQDLAEGTGHEFTVSAIKNSKVSSITTSTFFTKPNPPTISTVAHTTNSITVNWVRPASGSLTEYRVAVSVTGGDVISEVFPNAPPLSHTFATGINPATDYTVTVESVVDTETVLQGLLHSAAATKRLTTFPNPARNIMYPEKSTRRLKVTWQAPDQSVSVTGYTVTVTTSVDSAHTPNVRDITDAVETTYTNLTPGATYTIGVKAYKVDHQNQHVSSVLETGQLTMQPNKPTNLRETDTEAQLIKIAWDAAQNVHDDYVVRWKLNSDGTWQEQAESGLTHTIDNLLRGRTYDIEVVTISGTERSEALVIQITTVPDGVSLSIPNENGFGTNFIMVTWTAPNTGGFDRYELAIDPNPNSEPNPITILSTEDTSYMFSELEPGRTYTMTIAVVANDQRTPSSRQQTTKPMAVSGVSVGNIGTTSVGVSWQVDPNSVQDKFEINYESTFDSNSQRKEVNHNGGQTAYTDERLENLDSGYVYTISVRAVSNGVEGDEDSVLQATKPRRVSSFTVSATGVSSANLVWVPAESSGGDNYRISYVGEAVRLEIQNITLPHTTTEHTILTLFPGERYTYTISVVTDDQYSAVETTQVVQRPTPPTAIIRHERGENYLTFQWTYVHTDFYADEFFVQLKEQGAVNTVQERHVPSSTPTIRFNGLTPGQSYTVEVFSETFDNLRSETAATRAEVVTPKLTAMIWEVVDATTPTTVTIQYSEEMETVVIEKYRFSINRTPREEVINRTTSEDRTVTFSELTPGTLYTVDAEALSGGLISQRKGFSVLTNPEAPGEIECGQIPDQITLIIHRPVNGRVNEYNSRCEDCPQELQSIEAESGETVELEWTQLIANTTYEFTVTSLVEQSGESKTSVPYIKLCSTDPTYPTEVTDLTYDEDSVEPYQILLMWNEPRAKNGILYRYIINALGRKGDVTNNIRNLKHNVEQMQDITSFQYLVVNLKGGYNYTFEVFGSTRLENDVGDGAVNRLVKLMPVKPPEIKPDAPPPKAGKTEHDTAVVQFNNPFNERNGEIEAFSVIVSKRSSLSDMEELTWAQADGNSRPYVAIYRCSNFFDRGEKCEFNSGASVTSRRKRAASSDISVKIGADKCSKNREVYCNGPLEPDTTYYVFLRGYTSTNDHTDSSDPVKVKTGTDPTADRSLILTIVLAVICAVIIILLVVVLVCLYRRGVIPLGKNKRSTTTHKPAYSLTRRSKVDVSRPVKISEFSEHVAKMSKDSDFLFAEEYEELKEVGKEQAWDASMLPVNRPKNRFTNILPYDHSRVKLLPSEDEEGSDYINGNWMPGFNSKREFICTQGPLPATIDDFWRMVWEQNCRAIVMVTRCVEKGREKCAHYWPVDSEPMFYGDVQVEIHKEVRDQDWTTTEFTISKGETVRKLSHFHYTAWPDFDVPKVPQSLIRFVRKVRAELKGEGGPTVVHCSAGVGRSGTFIVVDRLMQHIVQPGAEFIDIHSIVHEMRRFRCWMVQTESQYIFIHRCIECVLQGKEHEALNGEDNVAFEDEGIME